MKDEKVTLSDTVARTANPVPPMGEAEKCMKTHAFLKTFQ